MANSHTHDPSQIQPVTTRDDLLRLLARAADFEHGLACAYMFTASSLKYDAGEGDLTESQASTVRDWKRRLAAAAQERMRHVAQLAHLMAALDAAPHIVRPSFPVLTAGGTVPLAPFAAATLTQLNKLEQANAPLAAPNQPPTAVTITIIDLYATITKSLQSLPAAVLFNATAGTNADIGTLDWGGPIVAITDQASALAAIAAIVAPSADTTSPSGTLCSTIQAEYAAIRQESEAAGTPFAPARPVVAHQTTAQAATAGEVVISAPLTRATAAIFNDAYDTQLLLLQRSFAPSADVAADRAQCAQAAMRLMASVIRPLGEALTQMPVAGEAQTDLRAGPTFGDGADLAALQHTPTMSLGAERLWQLATAATTLRMNAGLPNEIMEATAALQDLACQFAPPASVAERLAQLQALQAEAPYSITVAINGPYLVTNVATLQNGLGEALSVRPQMALCRCGNSASKPFCDGAHARIDFTGQKDPKRVPNRRDTYVGTQVTILDNRGICAHSGFCTDRLSSAFRAHEEPFVVPNGGRMDDLVRAVRACPSGALSFALRDVEARESVDQRRPPAIEISQDGPYRLTGGIPLQDEHGNDIPRNDGASREHYSLCRCGHSQNKPFCSGMHWYVNFHDPAPLPDEEQTLFTWVGGYPALLRMAQVFYSKYVPQDPLLEPIFAHMASDHPERVASWLSEVFHGPKLYSEHYGGYSHMLSQHIGKGLTEEQRARWVSLLCQAANDAGLSNDAEFRAAFVSYLEWGSHLAIENSTPGAKPPPHMPMPHWDWVVGATPGSRISALAPVAVSATAITLPSADEEVHFTPHIKPLFRAMDRQSMIWAFDLWSYADVVKHAQSVLERIQQGSMPCDGAWPEAQVAVFQRWVASGQLE